MQSHKTTPNQNTSDRRRRSEADLCDRTRAWIWLAHVRARRSDLSYDGLDGLVFDDGSRRRAFWRVARTGQSPDRIHRLRGFSLVERLGKVPGFEGTVPVYRSELWHLLRCRPMKREELQAMRTRLLAAFKLRRSIEIESCIGSNGSVQHPYQSDASAQELADNLRRLAVPLCLDWLALLCVLYRLAVDDVDLELALELQDLIREQYIELFQTLEIPRFGLDGEKELQFLIEARVLRGDTYSGSPRWAKETLPQLLGRGSGKRKSGRDPMCGIPHHLAHSVFMMALDSVTYAGPRRRSLLLRDSPDAQIVIRKPMTMKQLMNPHAKEWKRKNKVTRQGK